MKDLSSQQYNQECLYDYPYHYIPNFDGNRFSQTQTLVWGYEYLSYLHYIIDIVNNLGFSSLLDVGCGDGRFLFELNKRFIDKRLVGIDYSKRAIDLAQIFTSNIEWVCGDITDTTIKSEKYEIITLIETLEHIKPSRIASFLEGIHNYLKENGKLVITVPSNNIPVQKKHYQHFNIQSLAATLNPMFKIVDVFYLNHCCSVSLKLMKRILTNRLFILNSRRILKFIYTYYVNNLLLVNKNNCRRLAVICNKTKTSNFINHD